MTENARKRTLGWMVVLGVVGAAFAGCSSETSERGEGAEPATGGEGGVAAGEVRDASDVPRVEDARANDASGPVDDAGGEDGGDGGVGDGADGGDGGDGGLPVLPYKPYDINHVLSTGASDSVANGGSPPITTTQPFGNLSFDVGVMTAGSCDGNGCKAYQTPAAFKPLVEGDKFFNYGVETISSGLANQASVFAAATLAKYGLPTQHDVLVSLHGRSGNEYWCLRQQTANVSPGANVCYYQASLGYLPAFEEGMKQVQKAKDLAAAAGKTYVVRAVTAIHGQGESDSNEQNFTFLESTDGSGTRLLDYTDGLLDWQRDYDTRVRAITGQAERVPLFVSQFGSMTTATSIIPQRQLDAHVKSGGKVVLVAPNYPFPHYQDCNHYTNHSQRWLGAYFAKAYHRVVVEGKTWEPTRPTSITRNGNVIKVKYVVPVPPLVIDTQRVDPSGANFPVPPVYGFIYRDSTMSASITNVAVSAPDEVTITLSNAPTGDGKLLRYAFESQLSQFRCPGPTTGARGNLRDSDATKAHHLDANGNPYDLFNWSVAFQMTVP